METRRERSSSSDSKNVNTLRKWKKSARSIETKNLYWRKRLEGRKFNAILFRNGYAKGAPEMLVEFRGLRSYGKGRSAYYAIRGQCIGFSAYFGTEDGQEPLPTYLGWPRHNGDTAFI
jgi:hypothetical protein